MEDKLYKLRHSAAHVLAQAVQKVFPEAKLGIGPPIENGFYYDFLLPRPVTDKDLETFEAEMQRIVAEDQEFECEELTLEQVQEQLKDQPFKLELAQLISEGALDENLERADAEEALTIYRNGPFVDLCRGPHVGRTSEINPEGLKLLTVSAAYWRGDEKRESLQRIYGTAWESRQELEEHLERLEQARLRDHRTLGRQLEYFMTSDSVGPGLVLWQPKAGIVRYLADRFSQEAHVLNGYEWVYTPHIGKSVLWETSGHLDFYKDSMYSAIDIDGDEYYLKPMNCPFHIQIAKVRPRSYRELPLRLAEFGTVYRYERSGTLHGMTRVRGFTQDDAHIFCTPDQVADEIRRAIRFSVYVLQEFGLKDFVAYVSTRPQEKAIGEPAAWEHAQQTLIDALRQVNIPFEIDEGGGAFYGPKVDLKVNDSLGREWQLSTVQFDFNLPERFDMHYIAADGERHRPVMVHRALFGSAERFFALLIEQYGGALPLWLSPVQAVLIPITDHQLDYCHEIRKQLVSAGMRVEVDESAGRMNAKIRTAQEQKVPFMLVVGKREAEAAKIAVRDRSEGDQGVMTVEEFLQLTAAERSRGQARNIGDS